MLCGVFQGTVGGEDVCSVDAEACRIKVILCRHWTDGCCLARSRRVVIRGGGILMNRREKGAIEPALQLAGKSKLE